MTRPIGTRTAYKDPNLRKCSICNCLKPRDAFYIRKSKNTIMQPCVACSKAVSRINFRKSHKQALERSRAYSKTEKGREVSRTSSMRMQLKYPEKKRAVTAVNTAVKLGKLIKPTSCSNCGRSNLAIQGHHKDYSKPLDVVWLCYLCHRKIEGKLVFDHEAYLSFQESQ